MALFQKFDSTAPTKTHGVVDASFVDVINPSVPLADTFSNATRALAFTGIGWVGRGKRETGSFSL